MDLKTELENTKIKLQESYKREEELMNQLMQQKRKQFHWFNEEECWVWNAENVEDNYIDSLVCPVVICPKVLKGYLHRMKNGIPDIIKRYEEDMYKMMSFEGTRTAEEDTLARAIIFEYKHFIDELYLVMENRL